MSSVYLQQPGVIGRSGIKASVISRGLYVLPKVIASEWQSRFQSQAYRIKSVFITTSPCFPSIHATVSQATQETLRWSVDNILSSLYWPIFSQFPCIFLSYCSSIYIPSSTNSPHFIAFFLYFEGIFLMHFNRHSITGFYNNSIMEELI